MTTEQAILFGLVVAIFAFLIWGRVRYDVVAFSALVIAFLVGSVPADQVFSGFGHPAVVIIALVLIVSRGLARSGAIDLLAKLVIDASRGVGAHVAIMAGVSAALSSVMNNVAALALLMPMDMQAAQRAKRSPAHTLMPLSFASILGGMVTLIGTPPNIVIATFREGALGAPFGMLDFAPVGIVVAIAGVAFVSLVGWRLIPVERTKHDTGKELEDLKGYVAEARVPDDSKIVGKRVNELDELAEDNDVHVLGIVRRGRRLPGAARREEIRKSDLIVLEGGPEAIDQFIGATGLKHSTSELHGGVTSEATEVVEVVVPDGSPLVGRSAIEARMLHSHGVHLLGISRRGRRMRERIRKARIRVGDILLLLGSEEHMPGAIAQFGVLPLAERGLEITNRGKAWTAVAVFAAAIVAASFGWLYLPLALAAVVVAYVGLKIVPISQVYESVEWPVIVLLGSMIPIGVALESSGGTGVLAQLILDSTRGLPTAAVLVVLMVVTMTLSDVLNNVATALIAAPIGIEVADRLGANPDAFLMGVAVAASCAFLTPIGHKNNTIIMGPGGYKFGDYWRMGLPLELLVLLVSVPMILIVWPL